MERLTESGLLADSHADPRASSWFTDNVLHPFMNGTGVAQLYNNFASESNKIAPAYVPEAKTLSSEWAVHSLASASGAVVTYALAGKAAGMGLKAIGSAAGLEGAAEKVLSSATTAQITGAALYDFAKAPNPGETRLGNAAGSVAAFGVFAAGNEMLGSSKTIADSTLAKGVGRVVVGMAGGLTSLETSHLVSSALGVKNPLSWDDRFKAMASGGFINVAMPVVQDGVSKFVDNALHPRSYRFQSDEANAKLLAEAGNQLPQLDLQNGPLRAAENANLPENLESRARKAEPQARPPRPGDSSADAELPKLILLKEQFDAAARQAQINQVARELASFIGEAKQTLSTAIYDFRLKDPKVEATVVNAFNKAANDGVDVKIAFFQPNKSASGNEVVDVRVIGANSAESASAEEPLSHGPSPELLAKLSPKIQVHKISLAGESAMDSSGFDSMMEVIADGHKDGALKTRLVDLQKDQPGDMGKNVGAQGIVGGGKLMHDKYIVRDAGTKDAAIWTGSTNFTDDAFGSQDNNIIQIKSRPLADVFAKDFQQMWDKGAIAGTGKDLHSTINIGDSRVTVAFSPGDGKFIDAEYARRITEARNSVHIASMVISSPEILKALADKIDAGVPVEGIYDGPQMNNVANSWGRSGSEASQEKLDLWMKVKDSLVAKSSHPYSQHGPHDFMHNKVLSVDGQVAATGSFNMSINATHNAENVLVIESPTIATQYQNYIADLVKTYSKS
jgi:phosphatidylserine/phosphatidylglycerophosphate/cardiolipin synthase-like enzyme